MPTETATRKTQTTGGESGETGGPVSDSLLAPPPTEPACRVVSGGGGYVYKQFETGTIVITKAPLARQVGVRLESGSAWQAITNQIGPFPAPPREETAPVVPDVSEGSPDTKETSFLDELVTTFTKPISDAYDDFMDWLSSDEGEDEDKQKDDKENKKDVETNPTKAVEVVTDVDPDSGGSLDGEALAEARSYYASNANRYPSDMLKVLQEKVGAAQTGKFNDATIQAIAAYQQKHGLTVDGQAGGGTLKHMFGGDIRMRADAGSTEAVDKGGLKNVWSSAVLTAKLKEAWQILQPEMPSGTQLTSGVRTWGKTAELVEKYFLKSKDKLIKEGKLTEEKASQLMREKRYDDMSAYIRQNVKDGKKMYYVAEVGASRHCTGKAMDLSGAGLGAIDAAVKRVASDNPDFGKLFKRTLVESKQNCVHIDLK